MKAKPTIVLVHGLWADGSCWAKVISALMAEGYEVISVQNPTSSIEEDAAAARVAIERAGSDVILVGHSWGGFVITEAGAHPRVKALVYVAAFAPDLGETITDVSAHASATRLPEFLVSTHETLTLSRTGVAEVFAGDLPEDEQNLIHAVQQPAATRVFAGLVKNAAWRTKPSWYLAASADKAIHPDLQKWMASRAGSKTSFVDSSHVPMLSQPGSVVRVILEAAGFASE